LSLRGVAKEPGISLEMALFLKSKVYLIEPKIDCVLTEHADTGRKPANLGGQTPIECLHVVSSTGINSDRLVDDLESEFIDRSLGFVNA
jgi:hypothetical protein